MAVKISNEKKIGVPIEKQETAPIAAISAQLPHSNVPIPGDEDVDRAKSWVDHNEK